MKRISVMLVAILAFLPALSMGVNLTEFQGGAASVVAGLQAPGFSAVVNISFPAESHVKKAVLNIANAPGNATFPGDPSNVVLSLGETTLWAFDGQGYGALGNQTVFSDGKTQRMLDYGPNGGAGEVRFRLMKKAESASASLTINLTGNGSWIEKQIWNGSSSNSDLGWSVADAGDVNGDGLGDILIGEPYYYSGGYQCGAARLVFGSQWPNATVDLNFTSIAYYGAQIGYSVAGAGDVNRDGYDDIIVGAPYAYTSGYNGAAFIYFGGKTMDTSPDVVLKGLNQNDNFGWSVSGAGDVNRDGYDDVIVGAPYADAAGSYDIGQAYIFLGGQAMDSTADYTFNGSYSYDNFGYSVSGAGDVNADGYADVVVGTAQGGSSDNGFARVFFGGTTISATGFLNLTGENSYDRFGQAVSDAGDVNGDGYDDVIVGAPEYQTGGTRPGAAYIFLGGRSMDAKSDLKMEGAADYDYFGRSVSGAGDINLDGYGDFIVGAPYFDGGMYENGRAYVYCGGAQLDSLPELNFTGAAQSDELGMSVSGAGDVNGDGHPDLLAGAPYVDSASYYDSGRAYLFNWVPGILDPELTVGGRTVLSAKGYVNATKTADCLQAVAGFLSTAIPDGTDQHDNRYVDVPVVLKARSDGRAVLDNLSVLYDYEAAVPDFGARLEEYRVGHKGSQDASGKLAAPLQVSAASGGRVRLFALSVNYDDAPALLAPIPELSLDEDTANGELCDLQAYFADDADPADALRFSLVSATNSSIVALTIENNRFLSADAQTDEENDNWTGTVEAVVACADHWGSRRLSNLFTIVVNNVNDPPVITSLPPTQAVAGEPYVYDVSAVDGDRDVLVFKLVKAPAGMVINASTGHVEWVPSAGGDYQVTVLVDDGRASVQQSFTVSVPNRAPRFTSTPPAYAFVGVPFVYNLTAADDDNQTLTFTLLSSVPGMVLAQRALSWTPAATGAFAVSLEVSDGKASAWQNFTLTVTQPNRAPKFLSTPPASATAEVPLTYDIRTADDDGDPVSLTLSAGPEGMALEAGRLSWTPAGAGNFTVVINATDGRGGATLQQFTLAVAAATRPIVVVSFPSQGQSVEGKAAFSGTVQAGTHPVERVEARIDGGGWLAAAGNSTWKLTVDTGKLKVGSHALDVRAFDGTGWSEPVTVAFRVERSGGGQEGGLPMMMILVLVVVVIAVVGVAAAVALRRKAPPPEPAAPAAPPTAAGAPPPVPPAEPGAPAPPIPPAEPPKPKPPEREFTP